MKVAFVSTMAGLAWGGSEELWTRTAMRLCGLGHEVRCSVLKWDPQYPAIDNLAACGARMHYRPRSKSLLRRMADRIIYRDASPAVEVIQTGCCYHFAGWTMGGSAMDERV